MKTRLKVGDKVMVISGGNKKKGPIKGKVGKILRFIGKERVIVEGINLVTKHERQKGPNKPGGKVMKEAPIHISNVMYYAEKLQKPIKLRMKFLEDGTKVRGYVHPETKEFVQV